MITTQELKAYRAQADEQDANHADDSDVIHELCDEVEKLKAELQEIWIAAGRPTPREQLVVAVQQWKSERDTYLWTLRNIKLTCKNVLSST